MESPLDSELPLGRQRRGRTELREHTHAPLRGHGEQLTVPLYRSGRQAEALETHRQTGQCLIEQLRVDPAPSLRRTERVILAQHPAMDPGPRIGSARRRPRPLPVLRREAAPAVSARAAPPPCPGLQRTLPSRIGALTSCRWDAISRQEAQNPTSW